MKSKVNKYKFQNQVNNNRSYLKIREGVLTKPKKVDGEEYYKLRLAEIEEKWDELSKSAESENAGVAFVSFKTRDAVIDTIEEIDIVKTKLVGKEHYDALEIKNWEVDMAPPPSDIIWTELNKGGSKSTILKIFIKGFPIVCSIVVIWVITFFDFENKKWPFALRLIMKYFSPLFLVYYSFYLMPLLVYRVEHLNKYERKTEKEESFITASIRVMINNCLILPYFGSTLISYFFGEP